MDMDINVKEMFGTAIIKVAGRLNADGVIDFEQKCNTVLENYGNKIVLDFTQLEYLSSAGLCGILTIGKKLKGTSGSLLICAPQGSVRQILNLAGFNQMFSIYEKLEDISLAENNSGETTAIIKSDTSNRVKIITVNGKIDAERIPEFKSYYEPLMKKGDRYFVFNFSGVDYLSSAGLCAILAFGKELKNHKGKLAIFVPEGPVRHILEISGFGDMFPLCTSEEEAVWEVL